MAQTNPETSASSQITWNGADGADSGDNSSKASYEVQKSHTNNTAPGLTVTFKDVGIEVHGLGEDYGSTVASVVGDLLPSFGKGTKSTRVSRPATFLFLER